MPGHQDIWIKAISLGHLHRRIQGEGNPPLPGFPGQVPDIIKKGGIKDKRGKKGGGERGKCDFPPKFWHFYNRGRTFSSKLSPPPTNLIYLFPLLRTHLYKKTSGVTKIRM